MEMAAEPGLRADHPGQGRIDLVGLDRGEPHAVRRSQAEHGFHQPGQRARKAKIPAVAPEIGSREHELREPRLEEPPGTLERLLQGEAPAPATHVGHDAEGAEGIAPVLDLEERSGASHMERGGGAEGARLAPRGDLDEGLPAVAQGPSQRLGIVALLGAQDRRHPVEPTQLLRGALRVAARHEDAGSGAGFAVKPPDELPGLLVRAARHGAGVHDENVLALVPRRLPEPQLEEARSQGRGVVLVQAAAQRPKRNPRGP